MSPKEFVTLVVDQYEKGIGIFSNKVNAEELVPISLSGKEKAQYIFYVLQLDYAMKSQILYAGAKKLHESNPAFLTPTFIENLKDTDLEKSLKEYLHPRYINEAIKRYKHNTKVLLEKYKGDPRNIFENETKGQNVVEKMKDFRGFGPKIGNFFIRTMINTFDYKFEDIDTILPPVDIHDVRIAYLLGFTETEEMTTKNINLVKNLWNKGCIDSKKSWLIFDKALWLLGSEGKPKTKEDIQRILQS